MVEVLRTSDERFRGLADWPFEPHYLSVRSDDGASLRFHYVDEGPRDAAPVLLMHGNPTWSYLHRHMIAGLVARGHRVVAVDLMGMGRSDKPADPKYYTLARHVDWTNQWLTAMDLTDITLYCQDWGGIIGLCVARRQPDRFARIIASNTGLPAGEGVNEFMKRWLEHSQSGPLDVGRLVANGTTHKHSDDVRRAYEAPFPDPSYQAGAREFPLLIPIQPDNPGVTITRDAWDFYKTWTKPFLTVMGSLDQVAYKPGSHRKLQRVIPGTAGQPHEVIEGASHFIQDDAPHALVGIIDRFTKGGTVALDVDRNDVRRIGRHYAPPVLLETGQARLRVDRFALTSNNVTYAVAGDMLKYWNFFPVEEHEGIAWGRVPVWGFADVAESTVEGLEVGTRVYGYLPMATELVVTPGRIDERGFTDVAEHRSEMASAYNRYVFTAADPMHDPQYESHQMVLSPLFFTSFVIDDLLGDADLFGAEHIIVSSASSKTSIGTAFLLARRGVKVIGLTSPSNVEFVTSLGCYDSVVTYDAIASLPDGTAVFVDMAGAAGVTAAVHQRYGDDLAYSMIVGGTHWDAEAATAGERLPGPSRQFFFAPTQIAKRSKDWGREGLDTRIGEAWRAYRTFADTWIEFVDVHGPSAVEDVYLELVSARIDPRHGNVCSMREHD